MTTQQPSKERVSDAFNKAVERLGELFAFKQLIREVGGQQAGLERYKVIFSGQTFSEVNELLHDLGVAIRESTAHEPAGGVSPALDYADAIAARRAAQPLSSDAEDAAKWRALRNCARITALGSAGCQPGTLSFDSPSAHVTLNFWTHNERETEAWHREWFDTFVAKALRATAANRQAAAPSQPPRSGRGEPSGCSCRYVDGGDLPARHDDGCPALTKEPVRLRKGDCVENRLGHPGVVHSVEGDRAVVSWRGGGVGTVSQSTLTLRNCEAADSAPGERDE